MRNIILLAAMLNAACAQTNLIQPVTVLPTAGYAATGELRLRDAQTTPHYIGFKAPTSIGSNVIWTLPTADSAGCLKSNGSAVLSIGSCAPLNGVTTDTDQTITGQKTFQNHLKFASNENYDVGDATNRGRSLYFGDVSSKKFQIKGWGDYGSAMYLTSNVDGWRGANLEIHDAAGAMMTEWIGGASPTINTHGNILPMENTSSLGNDTYKYASLHLNDSLITDGLFVGSSRVVSKQAGVTAGTFDQLSVGSVVNSNLVPTGSRNLGSASFPWANLYATNLSAPTAISSISPSADLTYNLGDASHRWNNLYANVSHLGGTSVDYLSANSVASNLTPSLNWNFDLGSPTYQWNNLYAQNATVNSNVTAYGTVSANVLNAGTIQSPTTFHPAYNSVPPSCIGDLRQAFNTSDGRIWQCNGTQAYSYDPIVYTYDSGMVSSAIGTYVQMSDGSGLPEGLYEVAWFLLPINAGGGSPSVAACASWTDPIGGGRDHLNMRLSGQTFGSYGWGRRQDQFAWRPCGANAYIWGSAVVEGEFEHSIIYVKSGTRPYIYTQYYGGSSALFYQLKFVVRRLM